MAGRLRPRLVREQSDEAAWIVSGRTLDGRLPVEVPCHNRGDGGAKVATLAEQPTSTVGIRILQAGALRLRACRCIAILVGGTASDPVMSTRLALACPQWRQRCMDLPSLGQRTQSGSVDPTIRHELWGLVSLARAEPWGDALRLLVGTCWCCV